MSIEAMNWAYQQQVGDGISKSILVALANQADQDGKCWPSIDYIQRRTEFARATVVNRIAQLEAAGYLQKEKRAGDGGGRKSSVYHLNIEAKFTPCTLGQSSSQDRQSSPGEPKQSINNQQCKKGKRGSRLPADWQPSPALLTWAQEKFPDVDLDTEADKFRDFWIAKPGQGGVKLDWNATFRNWIRNAYERATKTRSGFNGSTVRETAHEKSQRIIDEQIDKAKNAFLG